MEQRKLYRSKTDSFIAGVAGGLAEYFNIESVLVRLIFVLMFFGGGAGILIYIILWILVKEKPDLPEMDKNFSDMKDEKTDFDKKNRKLYRSKTDSFIAGVAGGLAEYFNIESVLVRLIFVLISFWGGAGILTYIILWIVVKEKPNSPGANKKTF